GGGGREEDRGSGLADAGAPQASAAMHDALPDPARAQYPPAALRDAYTSAQNAATATAIDPGGADGPKSVNGTDVVDVGVGVQTRLFGKVEGTLQLPLDGGKVAWNPSLTFPGLQTGERLGRPLTLGRRASIPA